jgi:hypothetical protein
MAMKKYWWQILFIAIIATLLIRQGHTMDNTPLPIKLLPLSSFTKAYGASGAKTFIAIWFIVLFSAMSLAFILVEKWMKGSKIAKGLNFSLAWGMVYLMGVVEWYPVFGKTSLVEDIRLGMVDVLGILVVGILSGQFFGSDSERGKADLKRAGLTLSVVALFFTVGRYVAYSLLNIESGYIERPVETLLWTLITGLSFGALYLLTGRNVGEKSLIRKIGLFGLTNAAPVWIIFNIFYPTIFEGSYWDFMLGRAVPDTLFVLAGAYCGERLIKRHIDIQTARA